MNQRTKGVLCILAAALFFSMMSACVHLAGDLPTVEKALFRNLVAAIVSWIALLRHWEPISLNRTQARDMLIRVSFGTMGLLSNFYAIDKMNISDSNMLNKLSPFFAILLSALILKETPRRKEIIAVLVAFFGALLVIKPGFTFGWVNGMIGLFGGFCAGVAYTFVRKLGSSGVRGSVIVMCFSTFSTIVTLPLFIMSYKPMAAWQFACLLVAGISATLAQYAITAAYTYAPAREISVYDYTQVLFAAIWGFVLFDQLPDILSFIGYAVIIGAALIKFLNDNNISMCYNKD